jgi:galactose mutarotase-like enzyme
MSMHRFAVAITLLLASALLMAGCQANKGSITMKEFGQLGDNAVQLYTLDNGKGLKAHITNYGAIVTHFYAPDRNGKADDIVLGFDSLNAYAAGHPYFGCIAGRDANRIAKGKFTLDGKEYTLATNNGPNHLHGGVHGFDKKIWTAQPFNLPDGPALRLIYVSPDGEEGYPGTVTAVVIYQLTYNNEFRVDMRATTDAPTIIDLAQHTYWNLAGQSTGSILDHELTLMCPWYTPVDATLIPTGEIVAVEDTPFDFTNPKTIKADIGKLKDEKDAGHGGGYDHNYVVDGNASDLRPVAVVHDPASGRVMELSANQPGVQLYTGNFLDGTLTGKAGTVYNQHAGLCLETQTYPNAINQPNFIAPILRPGDTYRHLMVFKFSTK